MFSILAYLNSLKNRRNFPLIKFQTQCNMCWWSSSLGISYGGCNRHVDLDRDNLLRTGTELLSSWASFNQISSPTDDGGWSLSAVWNSGRPPYQWASGDQITITHRSDKTFIKFVRCTIRELITEMTNFISITDNCCCRFTLNKFNKFVVTL